MLSTNATNPVGSFPWRAEASCASFSHPSVTSLTSARQKPLQPLRSDSSDSASSDEASESDSDEAPVAKKKCPTGRLDTSSSHAPLAAAARPATKQNIWGSVLQEQSLAKDLGSWFGMNTKVESDRDVETYDYRNAKNSTVNNNSDDHVDTDAVDVDIADECQQPPTDDDDVNICDRETFGTSSSTTSCNKSSERNHSEHEQQSRKRRRNGTMAGLNHRLQATSDVNRPCARNRLSERTYDKEKDRSHIQVSADDSVAAVSDELVRVLGEPEHMKDTFGNSHVVDVYFLLVTFY